MALAQLTSSDAGASARDKLNAAIRALDQAIAGLAQEIQTRGNGDTQEGQARQAAVAQLAEQINEGLTQAEQARATAIATLTQQIAEGLTQAGQARAEGDADLSDLIVSSVSAEAQRRIDAVAEALRQALAAVTSEAGARAEAATSLTQGLAAEGRDRFAADVAEAAARIAGDEASLDAVDALRRDVIAGVVARMRVGRPGDNPLSYTLAVPVGGASDLPPLPSRYVTDSDLGAVARFSEPFTLSTRDAFPVDPTRVVRVRVGVRRFADSPDPSNEGVVVRILWLDQSKTQLAAANRYSRIAQLTNLRVSDGLVTIDTAVVADNPALGQIVPPYGARYGILQVQGFGETHTTDVAVLEVDDISAAQLLDPISAGVQAQVASLLAQGLSGRLANVEAATASPLTVTFKTINDARAATIDPAMQAVNLLGIASPADGRGRLFKRFPGGIAPTAGTWFQSVDGAYWKATASWIGTDDIDAPSAGPAIHAVAAPAQPNKVAFTWADRFGDQYIEPHALVSAQATTGLQGDQDAITAARDIARARWNATGRATPILFSRPFDPIAETAFDTPVHITGTSRLMPITPRASIRSVFSVVKGGSVVERFRPLNPVNPATVLDYNAPELTITGGAGAFVRVEKHVGTKDLVIRDIEATGYPTIIDWRDGTNPVLENISGTKCGLIVYFRNSGMNGTVRNLQNEFGGGVRIQKDASRINYGYGPAGDGLNGGVQQMEGTSFYTLKPLQSRDPAFGYKDPPVSLIDSGYALKFFDFQPQELVWSGGLLIQALNSSIADIDIESVFMNTNADGIVAHPNVFNAVTLIGSIKGFRMHKGRISDMLGRAVSIAGKSAADIAADIDICHMRFERNALGDFRLRNATGTIDKNTLSSPGGSIDEDDTCEFEGRNWYRTAPSSLSKYSDWSGGRGPGAPVGIPRASQIAGDPKFSPGRSYTSDSDGIIRINGR